MAKPLRVWTGSEWVEVATQIFDTDQFLLVSTASATYLPISASFSTDSPTFSGSASANNLLVSELLDVSQIRENIIDITLSSNLAELDFSNGAVFYISSAPTASMTFNVINVPTDLSKIMGVNVFVTQGSTGYLPADFQINGSSQTIRWSDSSEPTPTSGAGKIDIFSFTMHRTSSASWIVYAGSSLNY